MFMVPSHSHICQMFYGVATYTLVVTTLKIGINVWLSYSSGSQKCSSGRIWDGEKNSNCFLNLAEHSSSDNVYKVRPQILRYITTKTWQNYYFFECIDDLTHQLLQDHISCSHKIHFNAHNKCKHNKLTSFHTTIY